MITTAGDTSIWDGMGLEFTVIQAINAGSIDFSNFAGLVPGSGFEISNLNAGELTVRFIGTREPLTAALLLLPAVLAGMYYWRARNRSCSPRSC